MVELRNPHDRFFKESFGRLEIARDFLTHYLPPDELAPLDLDSLSLQPSSFIDPDLQQQFSDLLYQIDLVDGQSAYVYLLFEHKSSPDPLTPLQLLGYQLRIWEQALRQEGRHPRHLMPIIPLVIYHGQQPWSVAQHFKDLFPGPDALRRYWPDFTYQLLDLSTYPEEEIRGLALLQVTLLLFKYISAPDFSTRLPDIVGLLRDLIRRETGLEFLYTVLSYVSRTHSNQEVNLREVVTAAFPTQGGEIVTTIAEQWVQEGYEQGIEQGIQQGVETGERNGLLAGIALGLELRFGSAGLRLLPEIERLHDNDRLRALQAALYTAESLDEVRAVYK